MWIIELIEKVISPAHIPPAPAQIVTLVDSPTQGFPPCDGNRQLRTWVRTPGPQETEHSDQPDQEVHLPSTAGNENEFNLKGIET